MSKKNIIEVGYFNVNDKKNSILENAKFQDNEITKHLSDMESLTNTIKNNILDQERINDDKMIDFTKIKKNN